MGRGNILVHQVARQPGGRGVGDGGGRAGNLSHQPGPTRGIFSCKRWCANLGGSGVKGWGEHTCTPGGVPVLEAGGCRVWVCA